MCALPQAEEEKQRRKDEKKKQAATIQTREDVEADMAGISALAVPATNAPTAAMEVDEVPLLIDTTVPNLRAALDTADVVVHILDARDPLSFRSAFVERESKSKKQVFVLNKIGMSPLLVSPFCTLDGYTNVLVIQTERRRRLLSTGQSFYERNTRHSSFALLAASFPLNHYLWQQYKQKESRRPALKMQWASNRYWTTCTPFLTQMGPCLLSH